MSNEKETPKVEITKVDTPAPMTQDQVIQILLATQKELAKSQAELAAAILESRKPYVDPRVLEEKQRALAARQEEIRIQLLQKRLTKEQCPHTRTASDAQGNITFSDILNIKWMEHSNGIILGVCGTCHSQMDARLPKDRAFLLRDGKSVGNMGRARAIR